MSFPGIIRQRSFYINAKEKLRILITNEKTTGGLLFTSYRMAPFDGAVTVAAAVVTKSSSSERDGCFLLLPLLFLLLGKFLKKKRQKCQLGSQTRRTCLTIHTRIRHNLFFSFLSHALQRKKKDLTNEITNMS